MGTWGAAGREASRARRARGSAAPVPAPRLRSRTPEGPCLPPSLPAFLPPPPPPRPETRSLPSLSPSPRRPHPRLPARGAEARMALTPNLRKVESPAGEAEAGGGQPLLEPAGLPSSGVAVSVRAAGGDMLGAGALRGGKAAGRPIRIRSSTRNPEWPEKADCSDCGKVRVGVGRSRLGYTAGGAMRLGNIIAGAGRPPSRPPVCLSVRLSVCLSACPLAKIPLASRAGFSVPFLLDAGFYSGQPRSGSLSGDSPNNGVQQSSPPELHSPAAPGLPIGPGPQFMIGLDFISTPRTMAEPQRKCSHQFCILTASLEDVAPKAPSRVLFRGNTHRLIKCLFKSFE